jgi:hypothetical protein
MESKYDFRFSDSDLAAYLVVLGYEPTYVEIIIDKKHDNKLKGFTHFQGNREEFIKIQNEFINNEVTLNVIEFSKARRRINKLVKEEINKFKNQSLCGVRD